jgi:DNA-binding response OmpR family regulator
MSEVVMLPLNVVVIQNDAHAAQALAAALHEHFNNVCVTRSEEELRTAIPRRRADVAIVDLELLDLRVVERLRQEFGATTFVCTHRLADEERWAAALSAGAADCCQSSDVKAIVEAAARRLARAQSTAA